MKNINKFISSKLCLLVGSVCIIFAASSCNKEFNNALPQTFKNDTTGRSSGSKVLYIILDGVKGSEVQTLAPTNITKLDNRATYSFGALADASDNVITDASAWTTMITGVDYTKHKVTSEDFAGLNLQATPTIFTRIKETKANARTVSFASVGIFNDKLAGDATVKQTFSSDAEVKKAAVTEISTNNPSLVVAQFHSAEVAGKQGEYSASSAVYAQAITTLDGYVGELLEALKARRGYASENWLVVIASNKGAAANGSSASPFVDPSRNIYLAYYSPRFLSNEITQPDINSFPFIGTAPRFSSDNFALQTNTNIGNFGNSGEFTYMFKLRDDNGGGQYYPAFMGKRGNLDDVRGAPGWSIIKAGTDLQSYLFSGRVDKGNLLGDGKWHTYAFTIRNISGARKVNVYIDGENVGSTDFGSNADNVFPMRLGGEQGTGINMSFRDIALFNVGMTGADVAKVMRSQLAVGDPFYNDLIGYWPGDETSGTIMYDKVGGNNFTYSDGITFSSFEEISPNISPRIRPETYRAVPNAVDVPLFVYNWLNISVPAQWGLSGKLFFPKSDFPTN